jgi:hydrogenase expression/formation protein HypD
MEVCGTHTMAIGQHGLRSLLPENIRLVSGPGCPVCVTPVGTIDHAVALSQHSDVIITTFGDMMRVPGSTRSLQQQSARGGDVRIVYSSLDALTIAAKNPDKKVVFIGIGFETTAPTIAGAVLAAQQQGIDNFFVLCAHKTMPQAMTTLSDDPELKIDGYLCPAHVSTVIGARGYQSLVDRCHIPCVVTGFEALDILQGILMVLAQIARGQAQVEIQYRRFVTMAGNQKAQRLLAQVFEPCDANWRGIGVIAQSGLRLRAEYTRFDAAQQIATEVEAPQEPVGCLCGDVLKGILSPAMCPLFGERCTPISPVGACMVSSEGACAAQYRFGHHS